MPEKKDVIKMPSFIAPATSGVTVKPADLKKSQTVLYFYPKDDTSGCTTQGEAFRDHFAKFKKLGVVIYGISRDSLASHEKFKAKYKFPFELISDEDEKICRAFDVMKMKNMYGRKYLGVERSTFFIDKKGNIVKEWRKVKVPGHVEEVLAYAKTQI